MTERQTSKEQFGDVLSRTLGAVASVVGGALGPGIPILSAALSAASRTGEAVNGFSAKGGASGAGGTTGSGSGDGWDLLKAQEAMQSKGQSFNAQYLALQESLQKESREYTAITNIMKVRHDSAKSAINNIR
jgi:hypothetical protein